MRDSAPVARRRRAIAFAVAAALCAVLAASAVGGYRADLESQLGELRPALVTKRPLPARRPVGAKHLSEAVEIRRVPVRFLPPGVLSVAEQLSGRVPLAPIPAGSYVVASQLRVPGSGGGSRPALAEGRRPVEIAVDGAAALTPARPGGRRVDVIVTTEPGTGGGPGRTYVAARAVVLLGLGTASSDAAGDDPVPGPPLDSQVATLALTRSEALRLIHAESFARSVRLIAH